MAKTKNNNTNFVLFILGIILSNAFSEESEAANSTETTTARQNVVNETEGPTLAKDPGVWFGIYKGSNGTIEDRQRLINDLLSTRYDARNYPTNLTVELGVSFLSLKIDGLERQNTFQTELLLRMRWIDPRLQWNASDYGGHNVISIPSTQVWKPEIALLNFASNPADKTCAETNVLVASDGQVLWVSPCQYLAKCNLSGDDIITKVCSLHFGSWAWAGTSLDLQLYKNQTGGDFEFFTQDLAIDVLGSRAVRLEKEFAFLSETLPVKIRFDIGFSRKSLGPPPPAFVAYSTSVTGPIKCANGARAGKDGTCAEQIEF